MARAFGGGGGSFVTHCNTMLRFQKRAARIINDVSWDAPFEALLNDESLFMRELHE